MKAKIVGTIAAVLCMTSIAFASGIFTLKGKLRGFSETSYLISTQSLTYEVEKKSLNPAQLAFMKEKKTGQDVELTVTTESIASVRQNAAQN